MAVFELNVQGYSDWIDVFTRTSILLLCCPSPFGSKLVSELSTLGSYGWCVLSPGDKNTKAVGAFYVDVTLRLLTGDRKKQGRSSGVYLAFCS